MKVQDQLGDSDCVATCAAILLGVPRSAIEELHEDYLARGEDDERVVHILKPWFAARNLVPRYVKYLKFGANPREECIAFGYVLNANGVATTPHAVVYLHGKTFHDPDPASRGKRFAPTGFIVFDRRGW